MPSMSHRLCGQGPPSAISLSAFPMGCSCWCSPRQPMFAPSWQRKRRCSAFWGVISLLKYRVWLGLPDNSGGVKDSACSSARNVLVPVGLGSPLLLAVISCILFPEIHVHKAAAVPSSLLLLLLLGTSLSLALDSFLFSWCLVFIPAAPCSLPACLPGEGLDGVSWCLCHGAWMQTTLSEAWCQHPWKAHSSLQS